jgi:hypothetical protein
MPPTNPWTHLVELVVPGIIGAGLALFGVWLTNKNNAAANAANRQHALDIEKVKDDIAAEARSRDNRWAFRKEIYVNVITASTDLLAVLNEKAGLHRIRMSAQPLAEDAAGLLAKQEECNSVKLADATNRFLLYANLSPLATADDVKALIEDVKHQIGKPLDYGGATFEGQISEKLDAIRSLIQRLWVAGRKDLWGTPETQAKPEGCASPLQYSFHKG